MLFNFQLISHVGHRYYGRTVSGKMNKQVAKKLSNSELINELKGIAALVQKKDYLRQTLIKGQSLVLLSV